MRSQIKASYTVWGILSAAQVLDAGLMMQMQAQQLPDDWYK